MRQGLTLAIVGRPNVGKSSLFNRLLEQDRAIVTEIPGTTRDLVSETASIGGIPVKLYDTAGIRETDERVESLGIERSYQAMVDSDLTLVVARSHARHHRRRRSADRARRRTRPGGRAISATCRRAGRLPRTPSPSPPSPVRASPSCAKRFSPRSRPPAPSNRRPASSPASATNNSCANRSSSWRRRATRSTPIIPHEMLLLDLYAALRPIDAITGATTADDILNRIFSTFCIGK